MHDPFAHFTQCVLSNGLQVHSVFWDRSWIVVNMVIHSGGREDPSTLPGLAHFVEHVTSQNIPSRSIDDVREFLDLCGGRAEFGTTNYYSTEYKFIVPADPAIFQEALEIFGSMLLCAQIKNNVERERKVILREFNGRYPFHEKLEWDMIPRKAVFKGHRLETWNRPLGRPEGFLSATEADLKSFYDTHYVPANMSLVVVGGMHAEDLIRYLEQSPFGVHKEGVMNALPQPCALPPLPEVQSKTVKLSDYSTFKVDQAEYEAMWAFPASFPRQARRVFTSMLKKIMFEEIRQNRGLAYRIDNSSRSFQDICEYKISVTTNPQAISDINGLVHACLSRIGSSKDLFQQKLESAQQNCLMADLSGEGLADDAADDLQSDQRIITLQEIWDNLHKVTFEQMTEAASFLSVERQHTFLTCP